MNLKKKAKVYILIKESFIKSGLSQISFLRLKIKYAALIARFIIFFDYIVLLLFINANVIHNF